MQILETGIRRASLPDEESMCALSGKLDIQENGAGISGIAEDANQQSIKVNKWTEVWNRKREYLCLMYL